MEELVLVVNEDDDDDGQEEDAELEVDRGAELERRTVAEAVPEPPAPLCGDSSLISIWFFRGPVEIFCMLYWPKEDETGPAVDEEEEGDGEGAWEATTEGMEGAWVLVGELIGMYTCEVWCWVPLQEPWEPAGCVI